MMFVVSFRHVGNGSSKERPRKGALFVFYGSGSRFFGESGLRLPGVTSPRGAAKSSP
jgi:hypothetical protein